LKRTAGSLLAVLAIAFFTCCAVQVGFAARTSAAMPATCGVAMEVPDRSIGSKPLANRAERIPTPGAMTSGFTPASRLRGPDEVNDAGCLKSGLTNAVGAAGAA
jgi:hypothetical protein